MFRFSTTSLVTLGLLCAASQATAQHSSFGSASLLPLPAVYQPAHKQPAGITQSAYHQVTRRATRNSGADIDVPMPPRASDGNVSYDVADTISTHEDAYDDAMNNTSWDGNCCGCDEDCYDCGPACCAPCGPVWIGTLGGLFLARDRPNPVWLTFDNTNVNSNLLSSTDAVDDDYIAGYEIRFGRRVFDNVFLQATYWSIGVTNDSSTIHSPSNILNTTLTVSGVPLGGTTLDHFYDNAAYHRIQRRNEFHNVELNLLSGTTYNSGNWCSLGWLAGVRYFRFDESLLFAGASANNDFMSAGGTESAFYQIDVENNLTGGQVGGQVNWFLGPNVRLFAAPSVGIYANSISHQSRVLRGDGLEAFTIRSHKIDAATLAQLDLGVSASFASWVGGYIGYRVVSVSGMGLSDNQIPANLSDAGGIARIDSNGHLLLHGWTAGLQFSW